MTCRSARLLVADLAAVHPLLVGQVAAEVEAVRGSLVAALAAGDVDAARAAMARGDSALERVRERFGVRPPAPDLPPAGPGTPVPFGEAFEHPSDPADVPVPIAGGAGPHERAEARAHPWRRIA